MAFQLINFSPFASNVLDYVTSPKLTTANGQAVTIKRSHNGDFVIVVDGHRPYATPSNIEASRYLNSFEVGINEADGYCTERGWNPERHPTGNP